MSLPMMTFSFSPISGSILFLIAASVRTRAVSWKDAADRKDSVASAAFVMPSRVRFPGRGALARFQRLEVFVLKAEDIQLFARKNIRVARVFHLNLLQHLADDDLDVFVVDIDALRTVDGLNFL